MMKEYLRIGGKAYRAEANWNAIAAYCRRKGVTDLAGLDVLGNVGVEDVIPLMHCCLKEGERLEGRDLDLTEDDLGSLANAATVGAFMQLYVRQSQAGPVEDAAGSGKKKQADEGI